jgi:hypothetical protein
MPIYVWIKVTPNGQPTKIACEPDDIDIPVLKRRIKEQLSLDFESKSGDNCSLIFRDFDQVVRRRTVIRAANGAIIDPGIGISSY